MADSTWPGDRVPSQAEVAQANEVPDRRFLRQFKDVLLHSEDARRCIPLVQSRPAHDVVA